MVGKNSEALPVAEEASCFWFGFTEHCDLMSNETMKPAGENSEKRCRWQKKRAERVAVVDNVFLETKVPDFLLEAGKISQVNVSVDWGMLKVTGVTVQQWYNYERGTASVPTDHRVSLEGNQEGISIGTIIGNDGSVTVTAVPYISKDAKVNPVTFNGEATFSQQMNESTGVRTINIQDIQSGVTVTFDGVSL